MERVELVVVLLAGACAVAVLTRRWRLPYPIVLVLAGLLVAVVPGLPAVQLSPDVVFLVFLPPLLFFPAVTTSWRDFRANLRPIGLLALGLVLATTFAIGALAHAVLPGLPWAVAFALGAVVAPPDAVAATSIARRLGLPRRVVTVLEGESLVNDAASLVAYRIAVTAAVTGGFSVAAAGRDFVVASVGGVAVGVLVGAGLGLSARRLRPDPAVDNTIFLIVPYAAYLLGERLHVSGVLAVVAAGLVTARAASPFVSSETRLAGYAVRDVLSFVLTSLAFGLIGLQLRPIVAALSDDGLDLPTVLGRAALVLLGVIAVRLLWVFAASYLPRWASPRLRERDAYPRPATVFVVGWAGMRGPVSLAAALSLPLVTAGGAPFPSRDALVLVAFVVILGTLVLQGLTLPLLIRAFGLHDDGSDEREEVRARVLAATAALDRLDELGAEGWVRDDTAARVRGQYEFRRRRFQARQDSLDGPSTGAASDGGIEARSGGLPPSGPRAARRPARHRPAAAPRREHRRRGPAQHPARPRPGGRPAGGIAAPPPLTAGAAIAARWARKVGPEDPPRGDHRRGVTPARWWRRAAGGRGVRGR